MNGENKLRYPRPGLPLLPAALRPLFRYRVRHPMLGDGTLSSSLDELDRLVWTRRDVKECKLIAKALCLRLARQHSNQSPRLATVRVPRLDPPRRIAELPVSEMLIETLKSSCIEDSDQLAELSLTQLMDLPRMGATRVLELLVVLETLDARSPDDEIATNHAPSSDDLALIDAILLTLRNADVNTNDIRLGVLVSQLSTRDSTLKQALAALRDGIGAHRSANPWMKTRAVLGALHERLVQIAGYSLKEDLLDVLVAMTSPRKAGIVARRLGWMDGVEHTLQEVGDAIGVTRERVRQLESRAQLKLSRRSVYAPALRSALEIAKRMTPCIATQVSTALCDARLTDVPWRPSVLVRAAGYLGIPHGLVIHEFDGVQFLGDQQLTPEVFARVRRLSWKHARSLGAAQLGKVAFELSEELERRVALKEVRSLVSAMADVRWIDEISGYYWLGDDGNTAIFNTIRKMLSICRRLPIDDLYEGLLRSYRMDEDEVVPKRIILGLCGQVPWLRIRQRSHVELVASVRWQEVLSSTESTMVDILMNAGGALDHYDFRRLSFEAGIPHPTFGVYEGNSPLFRRLARGIWGLRGVDVDPSLLVKLREKNIARNQQLMRDATIRGMARFPKGSLFGKNTYLRLYHVTASTFRHHVMTLARATNAIAGTTFLVQLNDRELGQVVLTEDRRLRGLLPLLRNAGARIGQLYGARCDLNSHTLHLTSLSKEDLRAMKTDL